MLCQSFSILGAEAITPADVVVQVQLLQRLESGRLFNPLSSSNCPVLDAWGILYIQTTRVFCWVRGSDLESGGARCARRP